VVHATASTAGLLIEVFDSGPGIDASDLARIFERFYRGRVARQRAAGTGMGLAIARGMLAAEGGRVWADNRPEGGAVFCIAVPAEQRTATPVVEAS
jgi:signal transduction histidine kinase